MMNLVRPSRIITASDLVQLVVDVIGNDSTYNDVYPCVVEALRGVYKYIEGVVTAPITWVPTSTVYPLGRGVESCIPQILTDAGEYVTLSWWGLMDDSIIVYAGLSGAGRIIFNSHNQRYTPASVVASSMPDTATGLWVYGRLESLPPVGAFKANGEWYTYAGKSYKQYVRTQADASDIDAAVRAGLTVDDTVVYETFEGNTRVLYTVLNNVALAADQHAPRGLGAGTPVEFAIVIADDESSLDMLTFTAAAGWYRRNITVCVDAERRTMYSQLMLDYRAQSDAIKKARAVGRTTPKLYKSEFADPRGIA